MSRDPIAALDAYFESQDVSETLHGQEALRRELQVGLDPFDWDGASARTKALLPLAAAFLMGMAGAKATPQQIREVADRLETEQALAFSAEVVKRCLGSIGD